MYLVFPLHSLISLITQKKREKREREREREERLDPASARLLYPVMERDIPVGKITGVMPERFYNADSRIIFCYVAVKSVLIRRFGKYDRERKHRSFGNLRALPAFPPPNPPRIEL